MYGYSCANGIMIGLIIYVFVNLMSGNYKKLNIALYILAALFIVHYVSVIFI